MEALIFIAVFVLIIYLAFKRIEAGQRRSHRTSLTPREDPQTVQSEPGKQAAAQNLLANVLPPTFVVVDLETTGLDALRHEIIEIGAIRAHRGSTQHEAFQAIVRPQRKIPKKITSLTGITQKLVDAEGHELGEILKDFADFVGNHPLVTFNAEFDMAFLKEAAKRHNIDLPTNACCALKMARKAWPGRSSYKLVDLAKDGNLSIEGTHRAIGDCERALIVYCAAASVLGRSN